MRIAVFTDSLYPVLNGVSVSIDGLVAELRNLGHSVHIFAPRTRGLHETELNVHRFRSLDMPWAKGYPLAYPPYIRMLRTFRKFEFDIVHTHTCGAVGFVGLRWAQSHDLPIVSTYHTLYDRYAHYFWFLPRRYIRYKIAKHTNFYYNHVDGIVTPSEASMKWLLRHSVHKPIDVIPTGIPAAPIIDRGAVRQKLGIAPHLTVLLFVGRLAKEKNMATLLEGFSLALAKRPDLRLLVVGDGPDRGETVAKAKSLGIGDAVRFVGFVPRAEVDEYYAASDAFVFASVTETQGLVVQEAMSHGLPPILVDGGGAGASITDGENGLLCRNSGESLAEAILLGLSDSVYPRLSRNAMKTVRDLGPTAVAERVVSVYKKAIESHSATEAKPAANLF